MGYAAAKGVPGRPQSPWVGAYGNTPIDERVSAASVALLELQQQLLGRLQRLQTAERRLSALRPNREPSGARVIRQLERERQRLGRELHTEVGQMLAAIRIQFEILEPHLAEIPEPAREALQKISTLAQDALEQVRNIARRVHPPDWQRLKLEDAILQLWELAGADRRFETRVSIQSLPADPSVEIKSLFFRAAQEGIANVMRHARARRVDLTLVFLRDILSLQLRDDGVGFDAVQVLAAPASVASGIGLRSIREQAAELRGKVSITSGPLGTTLEISVPWRPRSA